MNQIISDAAFGDLVTAAILIVLAIAFAINLAQAIYSLFRRRP